MKDKSFFLIFCMFLSLNMVTAQRDTDKSCPVRANIGVVTGSYYPFFEKAMIADYQPNIIPYTVGMTAGVSLEEPHGLLLLQTGFIMDGLNIHYRWNEMEYKYQVLMANFPVKIAYDYRVNQDFSVFASCGINFTRIISYTKNISNAKPALCELSLDDCWRDILAYSVEGSIGFNYWFHPHFTLQVSPYFRYYFNCPIEADWLLRPTIGLHIGVNWKS